MNLFPEEQAVETKFNFAPMIDFLFLMLALFATFSISRATLMDTAVELASVSSKGTPREKGKTKPLYISILADGSYKWLTEFGQYPMASAESVQEEIQRQLQLGALSTQSEVLLNVDRAAPWQAVATLLLAIREVGLQPYPLHQQSGPDEAPPL